MDTIPEQHMRALIDAGRAEPLLPDTFPVPARYDARWWHQPTTPGPTATATATDTVDSIDPSDAAPFVPVSDELAARYDDLLRRRRRAHVEPPGQTS